MCVTLKNIRPRGLFQINAGLHALRRAIKARVPEDFNVTFCDSMGEFQLAYVWTGDGKFEYQETVTASTVAELLVKWQAVNWDTERRAALRCTVEVPGLLAGYAS